MTKKRQVGDWGENAVAVYLLEQGVKVVERNWQLKNWGEIDIIGIEGNTLVFVEVKTRQEKQMVSGFDAITPHKLNILNKMAQLYAAEHLELPQALRIDAAVVEFDPKRKLAKIDYRKNVEY